MATGKIRGITLEIGGDTTKLIHALRDVDRSITETQTKLKDLNRLLKLDPKNTDLLKQKQEALKKAVGETKDKVKLLKDTLKQMEQDGSADKNVESYQALQRELSYTEQRLKALQKESANFGSVLSQQLRSVGKDITEFGKKVTDVGKDLSTKVTLPLVAMGTYAVKSAADFEEAMAKVSTIANSTEVPIASLKQEILDLSNETGQSATDIADAVYNAISAGQDTADAVNFVSNATKLARAGFTDMASATDILTTALNAYGLEADQVSKVSDILITTQNLGKTTVAELSANMGRAIPTANAVGVSLEQLSSAYAVMTANGINTRITTTYLSSMLNELGKDSSTAAKAFKEGTKSIKAGGMTMKEAMESGMSLGDVLTILNDQAVASGTSLQNMFGSAEAGKAANVLYSNVEQLNSVMASMETSAGSTQEAFEKMETPTFRFQQVITEIKNVIIDLGGQILELLMPTFELLAAKIEEVLQWWLSLDEGTKNMILTIVGFIAAAGPVITILGSIIQAAGILASAIGFLMSPIGLVIAGFAAVVVAGIALMAHWDNVKAKVAELGGKVQNTFESIKKTVKEKIDAAKDAVNKAIEKIKSILSVTLPFPKIKLPHFTITGGFSLNPPSAPHFSVAWYKKAMELGMMFTKPTVLPTAGGFKGFGDGNGAEIVLGAKRLRELVAGAAGNDIDINIYPQAGMDPNAIAESVALKLDRWLGERI